MGLELAAVFFLWLLGMSRASSTSSPVPAPSSPAPSEILLPPVYLPATTKPAPAPWPQVVPSGLPSFPGPGWEFDEPPPKAVSERSRQLLDQLWRGGSGTFKIEQTAGRWIGYRAEVVRSGKKGVVAYRLKAAAKASPSASNRPPAPGAPAGAPKPPSAPAPPQVPVAMPSPVQPAQPPAAVPAPGSQVSMPDLKYGDGLKPKAPVPEVKLVQQRLGVEPIDGRFGAETRDAVIRFQVQTGLAPNEPIETLRKRGFGAVKKATWTKLFAVRA
jgi:hypothetical protein